MARTEGQKRVTREIRRKTMDAHELAPVPKRIKRGKARMAQIRHSRQSEDVSALEVRARHRGVELVTVDPEAPGKERAEAARKRDAQLRDLRAPWHGCNAGRAMADSVPEKDRQRLWGAICHIRKVWTDFDRAIGAPRRHAVCLRLMAPSDPLEADAATPAADLRTDEEKNRQARRAMKTLQGWLRQAGTAAGMCVAVVVDDEECRSPAQLVSALKVVARGIDGAG